jgi:hypothetical protein
LHYLSVQLTILLNELVQAVQYQLLSRSNSTNRPSFGFLSSPLTQTAQNMNSGVSELSPVDSYRRLLGQILTAHTKFSRIASINADHGLSSSSASSMLVEYGADDSQRTYRDSIRGQCRATYQQEMTKMIKHSLPNATSTVDDSGPTKLSILLRMLSDHKSTDEFQLVTNDLWENGKINAVMIVLERLWSTSSAERVFTFEAMDYSFHSFRSPNALRATSSVSMTLEAIKHVIANGSPEFITSIASKVLIPLIDQLRPDVCYALLDCPVALPSRPYPGDAIDLVSSDSSRSSSPAEDGLSRDDHLWGDRLRLAVMRLEACALELLPSVSDLGTRLKLLESVIKKKVSIRDSLPGYAICVKELLEKYPNFKEQRFGLFCVIVHSPVPQSDLTWAALKLDQQCDFTRDILGSRLLASEIILRKLLSSPDRISAAQSQRILPTISTISTPLRPSLSLPLPLIKQEKGTETIAPQPGVKFERMDSSVKRKRRSESDSSHSSASSHVRAPLLSLSLCVCLSVSLS